MGAVRTIVDTAWADIQSRFSVAASEAKLKIPAYAFGVADWFSRTKYPVVFCTLDYVRQETSAIGAEELQVAMNLVVVQTGLKPETLEDEMMDYTDVVLELLRDDHTFGGACQIGEFQSSDLYAGAQDGKDLAIAIVAILLRQEVEI